ncbi:TerD family protein [Nocardioides sp. GXZ039]|uniref:TerD family protein n=1 Tax=Nocardioides sp. GXZ039 TaxID=3136018 RepID=UPI0030F37424
MPDDSFDPSRYDAVKGHRGATKVSLTPAAPRVSLTKAVSDAGRLRVNLNWNQGSRAGASFLKRSSGRGGVDLDLGCLYELVDGSKGAVQALGNSLRGQHSVGGSPICWLDGDDRSGANRDGENLFVDLAHLGLIRRVLVYAFIYEGVPNWAAADGVVTLFPTSGPTVEVRLDASSNQARMCAIALLENAGGDFSVQREVRYVGGHPELDNAYGWGLQWAPGSK